MTWVGRGIGKPPRKERDEEHHKNTEIDVGENICNRVRDLQARRQVSLPILGTRIVEPVERSERLTP